jgi:4-amino-4-deoxy-L-arabinose transferase-like glycosyltransferase
MAETNYRQRFFYGFFLILVWAGIYLPGLGRLELRGEEGRRILPAMTMMESGNWIVPYVGGEPYLRKPPMINWLVATSFKLTGGNTEWAARLPSVLGILALALAMYACLRTRFGEARSLFAAIAVLTTVEIIDKGRMIEIDALYTAAFGIGLLFWIQYWDRSIWLRWLLPAIPLGIGLLLKGPLHLLFFYGIVIVSLWHAKRFRELFSLAHILSLIIMLAIFALWAVPHLLSPEAKSATHTWSNQLTERLDLRTLHWKGWLLNIPRSLVNFLPWILLLPFNRQSRDPLIRGLELGTVVTFIMVLLVPGSLPRYSLPLAVPICILAAYRMNDRFLKTWKVILFVLGCVFLAAIVVGSLIGANRWCDIPAGMMSLAMLVYFNFENELSIKKLTAWTAVAAFAGMLIYCGIILPRLVQREVLRPRADAIRSKVPHNAPIYAVEPGPQHVFFYLSKPWYYVAKREQLPRDAKYLLIPKEALPAIEKERPGASLKQLYSYRDKGGKGTLLVEVN